MQTNQNINSQVISISKLYSQILIIGILFHVIAQFEHCPLNITSIGSMLHQLYSQNNYLTYLVNVLVGFDQIHAKLSQRCNLRIAELSHFSRQWMNIHLVVGVVAVWMRHVIEIRLWIEVIGCHDNRFPSYRRGGNGAGRKSWREMED